MELGIVNRIITEENEMKQMEQKTIESEMESFRFHYKLNKNSENYDTNAVDHRVLLSFLYF